MIARAVVQDVSQQKDGVGILALRERDHAPDNGKRAVDIGKNKDVHQKFLYALQLLPEGASSFRPGRREFPRIPIGSRNGLFTQQHRDVVLDRENRRAGGTVQTLGFVPSHKFEGAFAFGAGQDGEQDWVHEVSPGRK
jgi:hypothetical protein